MSIPKNFDHSTAEEKWYSHWMEKGYFHSEPDDREPYTVVIPPPNVTGVLHMGHMLNNTLQDVLVRKARMEGRNACWVPGTDHASIATEAKVVQRLRKQGIKKSDLSREEFLERAMEWKDEHGGIILQQLRKLGASCDWERTHFTMDPEYSESVLKVFVDLFEKGLIYRGRRMINWDPAAKTALSDEEVIHKEVNSKLYHLRYKISGGEDEWVTIATTRPETILGDTAICVNPNDVRFANLHGKKAIVPICGREIPIIADEHVDPEFGTGCLKITPAHDMNDNEIGNRHDLEVVDILNADGTLNENGLHYKGKDRFEVRDLIAKELEEKGYLVKVEDHINKVGYSERTDVVIEPRLSLQWFLSMEDISRPALDNVMDDTIKFHPNKFKASYKHWMENIRDWCISRQLWWGHRIPAWYFGEGKDDFVVALSQEEALAKAKEKTGRDISADQLKQEEDVLDTWFSSWLWPISVFNGLTQPGNEEIKYYYPTNDLVTAPEIMFFWVARMIIAGYEYMDQKPFSNVYFTGIVRDKLGRKMSKSLGNSPDPLKLMEEFTTDGVRVGILISSPAGNDLLFDSSQCEQGRNFANKVWNAARLIRSWEVQEIEQPANAAWAVEWFKAKFDEALEDIDSKFEQFRISEALMATYKLVWDEFCSWFLEAVKPAYGQPIDPVTYEACVELLEKVLRLLHPFTPFITEELWHQIRDRKEGEDIVVAEWPKAGESKKELIGEMEQAKELITAIRAARTEMNMSPKVAMELSHKAEDAVPAPELVSKLANVSTINQVEEKPEQSFSVIMRSKEYFLPMDSEMDVAGEIEKIEEKLKYSRGFLSSVEKKLSNERFVSGAPEQVVAKEKQKQADAQAEIEVLEKRLSELKAMA